MAGQVLGHTDRVHAGVENVLLSLCCGVHVLDPAIEVVNVADVAVPGIVHCLPPGGSVMTESICKVGFRHCLAALQDNM